MVNSIDRIVIAVTDLVEASDQYGQLLGMEGSPRGQGPAACRWFPLPNTVIELVQAPCEQARIGGLVFGSADAQSTDCPVANAAGLDLRLSDGSSTSSFRQQDKGSEDALLRVDHIVLRTASAADCIALFSHQLGIRLALDKTVPEWGGRMLFFRTGKITLEVIESEREKPAVDDFWGIAFQCRDLDRTARSLRARGVSLSEIRAGRKPGTRVATVKSHCLGIPTLLLQPG